MGNAGRPETVNKAVTYCPGRRLKPKNRNWMLAAIEILCSRSDCSLGAGSFGAPLAPARIGVAWVVGETDVLRQRDEDGLWPAALCHPDGIADDLAHVCDAHDFRGILGSSLHQARGIK